MLTDGKGEFGGFAEFKVKNSLKWRNAWGPLTWSVAYLQANKLALLSLDGKIPSCLFRRSMADTDYEKAEAKRA